jgi:hypothetical protein
VDWRQGQSCDDGIGGDSQAKPQDAILVTWAKSYRQGGLPAAGFRKRGSYLLLMLWVRSVRARNVGAADY